MKDIEIEQMPIEVEPNLFETVKANIDLLTVKQKQAIRKLLSNDEATQTEDIEDLTNVRNIIKRGLVGTPVEIDGVPYRLSPTEHNYQYPIEKI